MDFVKEAITRMWSADTAAAIDAKLLEKLSYHAAARELACLRPLHEPIKDNDVTNARSFLTRLEVQKTSDNWPEKQRCFRELPDKPYILAAVVCSARVLERKLHIISALCDGLRVAAEWSHWPKDQRLQQLIQHRDRSAVVHNPAIQPALTPSPARAVIESGVPNIGCAVRTAQRSLVQAPSWALTCSSCATKVRLQCACEQTTEVTTTTPASNPPGVASTNNYVPLAADSTTSGDRLDLNILTNAPPQPTTICPAADGDARRNAAQSPDTGMNQLNAEAWQPRKRQRSGTGALDATVVTMRSPAGPSDSHAGIPYHSLGQTPTSQPGGTESRGPPGAVGPSAVPCSNVPPDRLVSAHRPIQLSSISVCSPADIDDQHPIEGFVGLIRERSIVSTHSGELLVSTIQDVNGDIGFEHQPGWYRTNWIGGCLRLVLSEAGARKLYGVFQLQSFKRSSLHLAEFFGNLGPFTSIHANGIGGVTFITEDYEVQWMAPGSLNQLRKKSSFFRSNSLYRYFALKIEALKHY